MLQTLVMVPSGRRRRRRVDRTGNGWTVSTETWDLSGQHNTNSVTEMAGGEMYLQQVRHNKVRTARRRRRGRRERSGSERRRRIR